MAVDLTWEEKLMAMRALGSDVCLRMRQPGDWYVSDQIEVVEREIFLRSPTQRGATPHDAVNEAWEEYTKIGAVVKCKDRYYEWTSFMWADVTERVLEKRSA